MNCNDTNSCKDAGTTQRPFFYPKTDFLCDDGSIQNFLAQRPSMLTKLYDGIVEIITDFLGAPPTILTPLPNDGTFHGVYIFQGNGQKFVLRVALPVPWEDHQDRLQLDAWAYRHLKARHIAHLEVYVIDNTRQYIPCDYMIMDFAEGATFAMLQDPNSQHLEPKVLTNFGDFLASVHTTKLAHFGRLNLTSGCGGTRAHGSLPSWDTYILTLLPQHCAHIVDQGIMNMQQALDIEKIFSHAQPYLASQPGHWLHGDVGPKNIITHNNGIRALIDWEDTMSGDGIYDLAYWGSSFRDHMLEYVLTGYYANQKMPDNFYARYWLYYLRIALSKTVHRARFGYTDQAGRQPASNRIFKALDWCQRLADSW